MRRGGLRGQTFAFTHDSAKSRAQASAASTSSRSVSLVRTVLVEGIVEQVDDVGKADVTIKEVLHRDFVGRGDGCGIRAPLPASLKHQL